MVFIEISLLSRFGGDIPTYVEISLLLGLVLVFIDSSLLTRLGSGILRRPPPAEVWCCSTPVVLEVSLLPRFSSGILRRQPLAEV